MKAVAQCALILELKSLTISGVRTLQSHLPYYEGPGNDLSGTTLRKRKIEVCNDVPLSNDQFEAAWVTVCAFEFENTAVMPTAGSLRRVWSSIMSAAVVNGLKLEDGFLVRDMVGLLEEDGFPRGLLHAVVHRLSRYKVMAMEDRKLFRLSFKVTSKQG